MLASISSRRLSPVLHQQTLAAVASSASNAAADGARAKVLASKWVEFSPFLSRALIGQISGGLTAPVSPRSSPAEIVPPPSRARFVAAGLV